MIITVNTFPTDQFLNVMVGHDYRDRIHQVATDTETGVITITPNRTDGMFADQDFRVAP